VKSKSFANYIMKKREEREEKKEKEWERKRN